MTPQQLAKLLIAVNARLDAIVKAAYEEQAKKEKKR